MALAIKNYGYGIKHSIDIEYHKDTRGLSVLKTKGRETKLPIEGVI